VTTPNLQRSWVNCWIVHSTWPEILYQEPGTILGKTQTFSSHWIAQGNSANRDFFLMSHPTCLMVTSLCLLSLYVAIYFILWWFFSHTLPMFDGSLMLSPHVWWFSRGSEVGPQIGSRKPRDGTDEGLDWWEFAGSTSIRYHTGGIYTRKPLLSPTQHLHGF
jgi:hypothetical protein